MPEPGVAEVGRTELNYPKKRGKQDTRGLAGRERKGVWFGRHNEFFMRSEANVNGETCNGQLGPAEAP